MVCLITKTELPLLKIDPAKMLAKVWASKKPGNSKNKNIKSCACILQASCQRFIVLPKTDSDKTRAKHKHMTAAYLEKFAC